MALLVRLRFRVLATRVILLPVLVSACNQVSPSFLKISQPAPTPLNSPPPVSLSLSLFRMYVPTFLDRSSTPCVCIFRISVCLPATRPKIRSHQLMQSGVGVFNHLQPDSVHRILFPITITITITPNYTCTAFCVTST